jgi:Rhamnan synthesis protein F
LTAYSCECEHHQRGHYKFAPRDTYLMAPQPKIPRRCCIFAHYDRDSIVDEYVLRYIQSLQPFITDLVFVSTSALDKKSQDELARLGATVICRDNSGYDFYSWKVALDNINLENYDEILQVNDSCYGPLYDFKQVFETMEDSSCDFWGITKCYRHATHIQSYFVCYRHQVIQSEAFRRFWDNISMIEDKLELIEKYEVGLSKSLLDAGFRMSTFLRLSASQYLRAIPRTMAFKLKTEGNLNPYKFLRNLVTANPTFFCYPEMLENRVPVIKASLIRKDPYQLPHVNLYSLPSIDSRTLDSIRNHQLRMGFNDTAYLWTPPVGDE